MVYVKDLDMFVTVDEHGIHMSGKKFKHREFSITFS